MFRTKIIASSLNSEIIFAKKVDLIGCQYFNRSKSNSAEVGFFVSKLLIQKEKDFFSILNFGIEVQ